MVRIYYTKLEQLIKGLKFYQETTFGGIEEIDVLSKEGDSVLCKSNGVKDYEFVMTQGDIDVYIQSGRPLYTSMLDAVKGERKKNLIGGLTE